MVVQVEPKPASWSMLSEVASPYPYLFPFIAVCYCCCIDGFVCRICCDLLSCHGHRGFLSAAPSFLLQALLVPSLHPQVRERARDMAAFALRR